MIYMRLCIPIAKRRLHIRVSETDILYTYVPKHGLL